MRRYAGIVVVSLACHGNVDAPATAAGDPEREVTPRRPGGYVPSPGTLHRNRTLEFGGVRRTYHFYEAGGHAGHPRPLVLVLHGGGARLDAFVGDRRGAAPLAAPWIELAEREGLHLAIPQALDPGRGTHWNDCRRDCSVCGEQDDVGFLIELVRTVSAEVSVDPKRVFVSGESNGGYMTFRLAKERPEVFAAFGTVSALMPAQDECPNPKAPASLVIVAGTADKAIKYTGGRAPIRASGSNLSAEDTVSLWRRRNGCEGAPAQTPVEDRDAGDASTVTRIDHACPKTGADITLYRVDGGGHVPPSPTQRVRRYWESLAGRQNHDLETAQAHWDFFAAHPRR